MLCLSRRVGQRIIIGDPPNEIVLTVLGAHGEIVRLGIQAPADVRILREELIDKYRETGYPVRQMDIQGPFCAQGGPPSQFFTPQTLKSTTRTGLASSPFRGI